MDKYQELLEDYKKNPCGILSIPYWKNRKISILPNMKIVHDDDFNESLLESYNDERYFRLWHDLSLNYEHDIRNVVIDVITSEMFNELIGLINESYIHLGLKVSNEDINNWVHSEVYCPCLWMGAFVGNKLVGAIISEYDSSVGEGVIEWLQVLPQYRNRGIATALVCNNLAQMSKFAEFATVSGRCDNVTMPEKVYRKCGFKGNDVWHILTRLEKERILS